MRRRTHHFGPCGAHEVRFGGWSRILEAVTIQLVANKNTELTSRFSSLWISLSQRSPLVRVWGIAHLIDFSQCSSLGPNWSSPSGGRSVWGLNWLFDSEIIIRTLENLRKENTFWLPAILVKITRMIGTITKWIHSTNSMYNGGSSIFCIVVII